MPADFGGGEFSPFYRGHAESVFFFFFVCFWGGGIFGYVFSFFLSEFRSCVKVEVAVLGFPS